MVKRVLSGAAEKRTPRWSIDPGNKANLGETRTAEVERFEKAPATTFPHGPAAVELPPNCHSGGPRNQRWRLTARLHESGRPGSNRRRPAWETVPGPIQRARSVYVIVDSSPPYPASR